MKEGSFKVQVFLVRLKQILKTPERILFIEREKNLEAMERFGLTQRDLLRQLAVLEPKHYRKGPENDEDGSEGSIWVFKSSVYAQEFYIKLKLFSVNGVDYLKILSFHD